MALAGESQEAQHKLKLENDRLKDMVNDLSIKNYQLQVGVTIWGRVHAPED
jgi:hypothetical protein